MSCDHQACHTGDPADGGGDASAAGRGCLQGCRGQGFLGGEEDRVVVHAPVAKLLAHDPGQGTAVLFLIILVIGRERKRKVKGNA